VDNICLMSHACLYSTFLSQLATSSASSFMMQRWRWGYPRARRERARLSGARIDAELQDYIEYRVGESHHVDWWSLVHVLDHERHWVTRHDASDGMQVSRSHSYGIRALEN